MSLVQCKFCKSEKESKCVKKKNEHVKVNKKRFCELYDVDTARVIAFAEVKMSNKKPVLMDTPAFWWDRNLRRSMAKEVVLNEEAIKPFETTISQKDTAHPLTGDLSRFIAIEEKSDE